MIGNIMKTTIDTNRIKMHYQILFKDFFHKSVLASGSEDIQFLNINYEKEYLVFQNKNIKES